MNIPHYKLYAYFQVSIVGDFSEADIESCILDYLGTVQSTRNYEMEQKYNPVVFRPSSDLQSQQVSSNRLGSLDDGMSNALTYAYGLLPLNRCS
jgi:hypothetical protein